MATTSTARDSRSVRLSTREWALAEAIGRMGGERSSAGLGIREALRIAEQHITADSGETLLKIVGQIEREQITAGGQ